MASPKWYSGKGKTTDTVKRSVDFEREGGGERHEWVEHMGSLEQ